MFKIEFDKTKILGKIDLQDKSVSEAIFSIYPTYDDTIFIYWRNYVLCLDRRGDMSTIYNDIIEMLQELSNKKSSFRCSFLSSTFTAYWNFHVEEGNLIKINPHFFGVNIKEKDTYLTNEQVRALNLDIEIDFNLFISEWHKLLRSIKEDLLQVGYKENLENFEYLGII